MKIATGLDGPFKFCTKCQEGFWGVRAILKAFGRNCRRADGLQVHCRACKAKYYTREYPESPRELDQDAEDHS